MQYANEMPTHKCPAESYKVTAKHTVMEVMQARGRSIGKRQILCILCTANSFMKHSIRAAIYSHLQ